MRLTAFRRSAALDAEELDSRACRKLESFLTPDVHGGVLFAGDWSVDNRRYAAALREAAAAAKVRIARDRVTEVLTRDRRTRGARLADGGEIASAQVVVAAGCGSSAIAGLPAEVRAAVRPVKGQLLRLRHPDAMPPVISHTIRATVRGADVYLVPRADGEVIVGATQEERGPDRTVTAGGVHDLLHDAMSVLPVTSELILAETCAGLRPGTPDNGPIVGGFGAGDGAGNGPGNGPRGLLLATGHYRNGILMSPVTADAIVACLTGQPLAAEWEPFTPGRFMSRSGAEEGSR
jgi:glycine oxidase